MQLYYTSMFYSTLLRQTIPTYRKRALNICFPKND